MVESAERAYDMIFLDNMLPDGTGEDFLDYLEQNKRSGKKRPKVFSVSGNDRNMQKRIYQGRDISWFFEKPLSKKEIRQVLESGCK